MNKSLLRKLSALGLISIGFLIYQFSNSSARATTQVIPTLTIVDTPEQITKTPLPMLVPSDVELKKEYKLINDINANGSIDPGDKITYLIAFLNKGPTDATNVEIRDNLPTLYFEVIKNEDITKNGTFNGESIEWKLDKLTVGSPDSVSYVVTLKNPLNTGITEITNPVTILSEGIILAEAKSVYTIIVPTTTPSQTPQLTPSPATSPTPITPTSTALTPGASVLSDSPLPTIIVGTMAFVGILVFTLVGTNVQFKRKSENKVSDEIIHTQIIVFREGVIIIFIVSAVLLMGISNTLQSDGVISILSAIVGYVFGRATSTTKG